MTHGYSQGETKVSEVNMDQIFNWIEGTWNYKVYHKTGGFSTKLTEYRKQLWDRVKACSVHKYGL